MAERNGNGNGRPGQDSGVVSLFLRIHCFAGGEWKPREEFSNRQLEKYTRSQGKEEISCRAHSTQIRRELKCEGPCAKWHPIENFSRSTRNHSKTWCMNCTDWQLSVEPGYAPYVPPSSLNEDEEEEEADDDEDDDGGIIPIDEVPGERIEDWIQGNPSELGDFDTVDFGTQPSIVGTGSEISRPSLLDTCNRELGGLPEALSAINLGTVPSAAPSYASVATASTVRGPASIAPRSYYTPVGGSLLMSDTDTASQTNRSVSNTLFSDNSRRTSGSQSNSVATSSAGGGGGRQTLWMENRFADLSRPLTQSATPSQRAETRNGWARPVQRRTNLVAPRYVASTGGMEVQPQGRTVYADADDDDSEDEC
ncbi:hypothetical protein Sste5344_001322 [Sporothrix stenoceras]